MIPAVRAVASGPVLLLADYAETRSGLAALLRAVSADGDGRLRVLLLARSTGEWWPQLVASTDAAVRSLASTAVRVALTALAAEAGVASEVAEGRWRAFAAALGVPVPEQVELVVPAGPVPILVLHAAALLAVLDSADRSCLARSGLSPRTEVLDDLLARESAFWLGSAQAAAWADPAGSILCWPRRQSRLAACSLPRTRPRPPNSCGECLAWRTARQRLAAGSPDGCSISTHLPMLRASRQPHPAGGDPCSQTWSQNGMSSAAHRGR